MQRYVAEEEYLKLKADLAASQEEIEMLRKANEGREKEVTWYRENAVELIKSIDCLKSDLAAVREREDALKNDIKLILEDRFQLQERVRELEFSIECLQSGELAKLVQQLSGERSDLMVEKLHLKLRNRELTEALEIIKDDLEYDISKGKVALGKARQALEVK